MKLYKITNGGGYWAHCLHTVITYVFLDSWWRHQMETFSALLALCAGISPVTGESPSQRPVTRSFDVYLQRPNKSPSKQSLGWWFETPSPPLWRHCNVPKHWWPIEYHIHIWQVSPQFSSYDTCLIWICRRSNIPNRKIYEMIFFYKSTPRFIAPLSLCDLYHVPVREDITHPHSKTEGVKWTTLLTLFAYY